MVGSGRDRAGNSEEVHNYVDRRHGRDRARSSDEVHSHGDCGYGGDRVRSSGAVSGKDRGYAHHREEDRSKERRNGNEKKKTGDRLKSTTIVLPALDSVGTDAGLQCGDWMAQLRPLMGDLATKALWWSRKSLLERLQVAFLDEKVYNTSSARQRMDLRSSALLMAAIPTGLKNELVASRHLTSWLHLVQGVANISTWGDVRAGKYIVGTTHRPSCRRSKRSGGQTQEVEATSTNARKAECDVTRYHVVGKITFHTCHQF